MIRSCIFAAAAAVALAAPISAMAADAGDPTFEAFRKLCGATHAEYANVKAAADADGWKDDPGVLGDDPPNVSITDKMAASKGAGANEMRLRATRGLQTTKTGNIVVSSCVISTDGGQPGLLDRAKTWLKVDPWTTDTGKESFLLTFKGDNAAVLAQGDIGTAIGAGGAHLLKFRQDGGAETLDYERFSQ
jgi:hypothetical protein